MRSVSRSGMRHVIKGTLPLWLSETKEVKLCPCRLANPPPRALEALRFEGRHKLPSCAEMLTSLEFKYDAGLKVVQQSSNYMSGTTPIFNDRQLGPAFLAPSSLFTSMKQLRGICTVTSPAHLR
eukprot:2997377-Amphidinium_carterae.1